jgi:putative flavoprotein involved in K+ transport
LTAQDRDLVIGAGAAGLAVAAMLRAHGRDPVVVDRAHRVGASWWTRYDCLQLNTARWWSGLPGYPIPRTFGTWVKATDYARYLDAYALHHRLDVRLGVSVETIAEAHPGWKATTSAGEMRAANVVVATGYDREPFVPAWPGLDTFIGRVLHSSAYRNSASFVGIEALVVGGGNSATDIAVDLVRGGASRVWLSIRTPPQIVPRTVGRLPMQSVAVATRRMPAWVGDGIVRLVQRLVHGDLSRHGLPRPRESVSAQFGRADVVPVIDVEFVRAVRRGDLYVVPAVSQFDRDHVVLADGSRVAPRLVVAATGYRRGLERMVGHLAVLDERGRPVSGVETPRGLFFVGFSNPLSGNLREIGIEAATTAKRIGQYRTLRRFVINGVG